MIERRYEVSLFFYPEKRNTWEVKQFFSSVNPKGVNNHKRKVIEVQEKESNCLHRNDCRNSTRNTARLK